MMADNRNIAHADESHRDFNRRFEQKPMPKPVNVNGPWLSNDVLEALPRVKQDFERTREATNGITRIRSDGHSERGSGMVEKDKPAPAYRPSNSNRNAVDRESFRERWLAEQRDAVMAQTALQQPSHEPQREVSRSFQEPSR